MVEVRVVKTVEVVISGGGVTTGEEVVGPVGAWLVSAVDSEDADAPELEAEDSMALLEAVFAGPVTVVVRVTGPPVLLGETWETWTDDECEDGMDTVMV